MEVWCVACASDEVPGDVIMARSRVTPGTWVCLMCGKTVVVVG